MRPMNDPKGRQTVEPALLSRRYTDPVRRILCGMSRRIGGCVR